MEVRAVDDRDAQSKKGIEQQRRERQLIGLVVEPVRSSEVLREGFHLAHAAGGMQCQRKGVDPLRHLRCVEVYRLAGHQLFRQRKHVAVELEQVSHSVIVLEPVQSAWRIALGNLPCGGGLKHRLERSEHRGSIGWFELRLVLGRHVAGVDDVDDFLDEFRLGKELAGVGDLLEVDLALYLLAAVALDAVLGKDRLQLLLKIIRRLRRQHAGKPEKNQAHAEALRRGGAKCGRPERTRWLVPPIPKNNRRNRCGGTSLRVRYAFFDLHPNKLRGSAAPRAIHNPTKS